MNKKPQLIDWIIALSAFGVLLSIYSLLHKTGFTSGAVCNINETFNCDIVNQGPYSEVFGLPVAGIGVIGYLFLFVAALMKKRDPADRSLARFLVLAAAGGFLFALYLSGIEAFVLYAWCLVCLGSQTTITLILILSVLSSRTSHNS